MNTEWRTVQIKDLGRVVTGRTPPGSDSVYFGSNIPFLTPTDMDGRRKIEGTARHLSREGMEVLKSAIVPEGVAVSCIGWQMGKAVILEQQFASNQQINTIVPNRQVVDPLFLFYSLSIRRDDIFRLGAGGSRTPILNKSGFESFRIVLPPLPEQRTIARVLGALDDKIELNRKMNATLEELARAIFQSWFVDFDPVRAKAEGRAPVGMDAATAALFPDAFEEIDGHAVPIEWNIGSLEEIATVIMGASPDGATYNEHGVGLPLVNGPVEFGDYFTVKKKWTTSPTRLSQPGDLIFCVRGSTTGRRVHADDVYCLGRGVCAIRAIKDVQPFVDQVINVELNNLLTKTTGSVFPNLSSQDIRHFKLLIPPQELLEKYCTLAKPIQNKVKSNIQENLNLAGIRDSLLPKLLSGELRVREAEQIAEGVL